MIADALCRIAARTGRDDDYTYVQQYLDRFVAADGTMDAKEYPFELYSLDRIRPATALLWIYDRTKDERYMKAARYVATQLDKQPRTSDGGYWHRSTYPNQMWLDGIYMADVYAVQFANRTGQRKYYDEAVKQITLIHKHTLDPKTGLYYHGWDETRSRPWANKETGTSPEFWARAIGWYAMAMSDVMDGLPANHPGRKTVLPIFQALCRNLLKFQDRDTGMWFQIMDKPTAPKNYVETSSTLMFAYAMARGAQRGYLPAEFLGHARRATRGVLNHQVDLLPGNRMDIRGTVRVGSLGGDGGFYDYYVGVPVVTNDQKAIGAFMFLSMALSEIANPGEQPGR
jgi:unsaturated rhamnogalacturonyl hydrolase